MFIWGVGGVGCFVRWRWRLGGAGCFEEKDENYWSGRVRDVQRVVRWSHRGQIPGTDTHTTRWQHGECMSTYPVNVGLL